MIDNGPGIPPQDRTLIYQRFFRGSSSAGQGPGFGLGLSIVRHLALLHGGSAAIDSAGAGQGVTVTVRLLVRLSVLDEPLSDPAARSGVLGAATAVSICCGPYRWVRELT